MSGRREERSHLRSRRIKNNDWEDYSLFQGNFKGIIIYSDGGEERGECPGAREFIIQRASPPQSPNE